MSSSDPNIKKIQIRPEVKGQRQGQDENNEGEVSDHFTGGGAKAARKTRKKTRKFVVVGTVTKEGGGSTSPGTMTQLSASHIPGNKPMEVVAGVNSALTQSGRPYVGSLASVGGSASASDSASAKQKQQQPVKVVLDAPKKQASKVHLSAAATHKKVAQKSINRKTARKIRVCMRGLSKKIHRAKKICSNASSATPQQIREVLHKAGLIAKADSKAPEEMLRQMYADYLMLKNRAL
jgi:hypothetical protein